MVTKKQHYVPQFYLRQWVDSTGGFYPIKIENKMPPNLTIFPNKSNPSRFCYENLFYAQHTGKEDEISQYLEKNFADIEGMFSKELPNLEAKILNNKQILKEDKYHLSEFMVFLWLKGKEYRENSQRMLEDAIKQINKHLVYYCDRDPGIKTKMEQHGITKADMIDFAERGEYTVDFGNIYHLSMMKEMQGFCNMLFAKFWRVYISRNGEFITTDAPYLDMPVSKSFYGNDFLSREQTFILSPRVVIVALYPKNQSNDKKFARKDITDHKSLIQSINCHSLMNSIRFGFHQDKTLLEELQNYISFIYQVRSKQDKE